MTQKNTTNKPFDYDRYLALNFSQADTKEKIATLLEWYKEISEFANDVELALASQLKLQWWLDFFVALKNNDQPKLTHYKQHPLAISLLTLCQALPPEIFSEIIEGFSGYLAEQTSLENYEQFYLKTAGNLLQLIASLEDKPTPQTKQLGKLSAIIGNLQNIAGGKQHHTLPVNNIRNLKVIWQKAHQELEELQPNDFLSTPFLAVYCLLIKYNSQKLAAFFENQQIIHWPRFNLSKLLRVYYFVITNKLPPKIYNS